MHDIPPVIPLEIFLQVASKTPAGNPPEGIVGISAGPFPGTPLGMCPEVSLGISSFLLELFRRLILGFS